MQRIRVTWILIEDIFRQPDSLIRLLVLNCGHGRVELQHLRIVARHDVMARARKLLQRLVALERVTDTVGDGKHAALVDMRVEVARVGSDNDMAALRLYAHALQAF